MRINRMGTLFLLLLMGLMASSCNKDEEIAIPSESTTDTAIFTADGNNNGPNGNGNGNGGGVDVEALSPELVTDWTDLLLELERYAAGMRPNASARALAYIYLASYETALPNMRGYDSNSNRLRELRIDDDLGRRGLVTELALNACFADAIDHFLINLPAEQRSRISSFEAAQRSSLIAGLSDREIADSEAWGSYVAQQVITYSQTDDAAETQILDPQPTSYEPPTGDGFWTYSAEPERALYPYWEQVRTFVISHDETTTIPPVAYSTVPGSDYREQMEEVVVINDAARADDGEQLWIAEFWSDDVENLMLSPPARQIAIANQLVDQYGLNMSETLELYVRLGFALNDGAVAAWKYKYEHMVMRPSVYIQEFIDAGFQTNLFRLIYWPNPGFPGYPSGHSCFASAAGGIFIETFGNATNFTDRTHEGRTEFRGAPRTFTSFEQLAEENAFSRIPLGVHIRMDCTEGLRLGYEISDAVNDFDLRQRPGGRPLAAN